MTQTTTQDAIREAVLTLLKARQDYTQSAGVLDMSRRLWEEENARLISQAKETADLRDIAERQLRDLAVQLYEDSGDKHPGPGVAIRLMTRLSYDDRQALEWAKKNNLALALNKRAFESIAETMELPFVKISKEPQATIAQDLAAALAEEEV